MPSQKRIFSLGLGVLVILGLLICAPAAWSDWDEGDPYKMHYPQRPDLVTGVDVEAIWILADDFQCTASGPIADIHIWGSYLEDNVYDPSFKLQIWSNVPADDPGNEVDYSHPGDLLWTWETSTYTKRLYATANEDFINPTDGSSLGSDTEVWQFNFYPDDPFIQEEGTIFWLSVWVGLNEGFGWKTSAEKFEDYAVFQLAPGEWLLIAGERDMAFVITPIPPSLLLLGSGLLGLGALGLRRKRG